MLGLIVARDKGVENEGWGGRERLHFLAFLLLR